MPTSLQNIFRFFILVLVQVLILNSIQFLGYVNPYIYILFLLSLPVRTPRWFQLLLAFVLGLTIDAFANTIGLHAFACVLIAFMRPGVIGLFTAIEPGNNPTPSFKSFGISAYVKYLIVMVLIHHITLFALEVFSFNGMGLALLKGLINSVITILIILGIQSVKKK